MATPVAEQVKQQVQSVGPYYFTEQEYETMRQAGLLRADERTEWIDGGIYEYGAQGVQPRRFTTAEYYQLVDIGVLEPKSRVELIEGIVVNKMSSTSLHAAFVSFLPYYFIPLLDENRSLRNQHALRISEFNEPEPDIALVDHKKDWYTSGHPTPADVHLLVEVSDATLRFDRTEKVKLYANARIPELWIIDANRLVIYQYEQPANGEYTSIHAWREVDTFTSKALPNLTTACETLFAPFRE